MTKILTNRIYFKAKLYICIMEESTPIQYLINNFNKIISHLKNIEVIIADEYQALIIPLSLSNLIKILCKH